MYTPDRMQLPTALVDFHLLHPNGTRLAQRLQINEHEEAVDFSGPRVFHPRMKLWQLDPGGSFQSVSCFGLRDRDDSCMNPQRKPAWSNLPHRRVGFSMQESRTFRVRVLALTSDNRCCCGY